ncbi:thymidylate kinase [Chiua virens]|nr:thymidylate kinase [Chiua virens]
MSASPPSRGSGKSTQAARLVDRIRSELSARDTGAVLFKFPDRTTAIGKMIDAYLRSQSDLDDHAIHLLFAANRWELACVTSPRRASTGADSRIISALILLTPPPISPTILTHLAAGTTVIADRYAFSGIAFSAQKNSDHLTYEWCKAPEVGLPAPDLTLFLDIKPEAAMERGGYGEERYERQEVQARVRHIFERIGDEMGDDRWVTIDAGQDRDGVAEGIWKSVIPVLEGTQKPVTRLWQDQEGP